jgi:DNA-binding MarR family transcriptional regulator
MAAVTVRDQAPAGRADELDALGKALRRMLASLRKLRGRQSRLGGQEVSHAQFELLIELFERGRLSVGELAEAAQLTPATVTGMLDHLVAGGHVERKHSEQDRRVVVCTLTDQGGSEVKAFREAKRARWQSALADVPVEDLQAAARVLDRIGEIFEEAS